MNPKRVLKILNLHLTLNSYSTHKYQSGGSYKLSILGLIVLLSTAVIYIVSLYMHYAKQDYFENYNFLSKLFYKAVYIHLYLGCLAALLIIFDIWGQIRFARKIGFLVDEGLMSGKETSARWTLMDLFVLYKLYSNPVVFLGLSVYNIIMLDFEFFAWYKLMLFLGLFLPHFYVANVLNFFCINALLLRSMCARINEELLAICIAYEFKYPGYYADLRREQSTTANSEFQCPQNASTLELIGHLWKQLVMSKNSDGHHTKTEIRAVLETIHSKEMLQQKLADNLTYFGEFQRLASELNGLLHKQLMVFGLQHLLVLFVAFHCFLKIMQQWKVFVPAEDITSIRVNFQFYTCLLINDFVCLFCAGSIYRNEVNRCPGLLPTK